ncbi:MAG: (2Fe-2S) ferredoxin domain-containing protein [Gammaproteobacteria bacterium]|nr:(2Fe-2S) ferredoxin domain-containing protein [Gammaproteobacteria bacterium]
MSSDQTAFYSRHVFFCTNRRDDDRPCCGNHPMTQWRDHAKDRVKALGLAVQGGVRINNAGCLGRCEEGPLLVVYPDGVWYTCHSEADIDEIVDSHLKGGRVVERLRR